jgi:Leucine-rich repeat (LRR) protein
VDFGDEVNLQKINLSENMFDAEDLKYLEKSRDFEVIDLSCNKLGNPIDNFYSEFEKLKTLNLSRTLITNLTAETFKNQSGIEILDLSGNNLETLEFNWFSSMKLKSLDISDNRISGIKDLENLKLFPHLQSIDLMGNDWNCGFLSGFIDDLERNNVTLMNKAFDPAKKYGKFVQVIGCIPDPSEVLNEKLENLLENVQNLTNLYEKSIELRDKSYSQLCFLVLIYIAGFYFIMKITFLIKDHIQNRQLSRTESYKSVMIPLFQES